MAHHANSSTNGERSTSVWQSVSKWLRQEDAAADFWWNFSGPHLAKLLLYSDYKTNEQYEALLFFFRQVVPKLGPIPTAAGPSWPSLLTFDGTNIEYCWRWNTAAKTPEIRFAVEPMSRFRGTLADPLNLNPTYELFHDMSLASPSLDPSLYNHFASALFDSEKHKYLEAGERLVTTSVCVGFEFLKSLVLPKAYWAPRKLQQPGLMHIDTWEQIIRAGVPQSSVLDDVLAYIRKGVSARQGCNLNPFMLGVDLVKPESARLKIYCQSTKTNFESVRGIMTFDGAKECPEATIEALWDLIRALLSLPDDFARSDEVPGAPGYDPSEDTSKLEPFGLLTSFFYYFDVGARRDRPDIKLYIPIHHYGRNDQVVADAVTAWMTKHGRGQYVDRFRKSMEFIADHRTLKEGSGIQSYIALMLQGDDIQVTSYLMPEAFHSKRTQESKAVR